MAKGDDALLAGLGIPAMSEDETAGEEPSGELDTDAMAAEEVADDLMAGMDGDRAALLRAVRVLMRRD